MADRASPTQDSNSEKSSIKTVLLGSLFAIILGMSSGFAVGYFTYIAPSAEVVTTEVQPPADQTSETAPEHKTEAEGEAAKPAEQDHGAGQAVAGNISLEPIVTNLAEPADIWIRLELVLVGAQPIEADLIMQIHEDLFAFVHTMHLSEMTGSSALIDLKSELLARAKQRSSGRIKKIYIKTLLFE